jgi:mono/diheme cytochrome c family protein
MVLRDSHQHVFAWSVVIFAVLSIVIASCSTTDQSGRQQARDSSFGGQADPPDAQGDPNSSSAGVESGKELYVTLGCMGCHVVNGKGGQAGPDLSNEANKGRAREWLTTKIRIPKADNPQTTMPAYATLSGEQVNNLVDYLLSLTTTGGPASVRAVRTTKGRPTASAASSSSITTGGILWSHKCGQCHNLRPPSDYSGVQWAVAVHHMRVRVPLSGQEQRDILAFLQASN